MFKNPFSFNGRIRRTEYGLTFIIYLVVYLPIYFSVMLSNSTPALFLILIPLMWFVWAQGAKRCHDRGNSGWWQIIPFYGLWLLFGDGQPGENQYGPDPKGRMNPFDEYDYITKKTEADDINPQQ